MCPSLAAHRAAPANQSLTLPLTLPPLAPPLPHPCLQETAAVWTKPTAAGEAAINPFHPLGPVKRLAAKPLRMFEGTDHFLRLLQAEKEGLVSGGGWVGGRGGGGLAWAGLGCLAGCFAGLPSCLLACLAGSSCLWMLISFSSLSLSPLCPALLTLPIPSLPWPGLPWPALACLPADHGALWF